MSDQIEFSSFYKLLNSIKEGKSEQIPLLDETINDFQNGNNSKSFLDELGSLYLSIGMTELYNFANTRDLQEIGLIDKEGWETLSSKNQQELPVYLANKMIEYIKENKKVKEMSTKWNIKEGEIRKHITKMARYITEGIIDVIE
ncbi:hypothetical protein DNJ72_08700 [Prochlorococcus marinus XMU1403]|uniref:hypothetical protein n=1 Tax=Prochlorococcus marinus TaxID=1219 RepID=UPI000D80DB11|nr:hypothetical protein [Prochlorococcus marinus]MBW3050218.1 hypothetical protein [Prochlorococcus marinus str. MU1403]PYE00407.1 hypothetical protein DNJ72_08700 [Prochlorococcus marinus XMU1403]